MALSGDEATVLVEEQELRDDEVDEERRAAVLMSGREKRLVREVR
jgi:hypothetical protein